MTVRDLIDILESYDEDAEVIIGMRQRYGTDFAKGIEYDIAERKIRAFYGADFKAVVITEGSQIGAVVYNDDDDDWYDDED